MEGVTGLFICLVFIAPVYTYTLIGYSGMILMLNIMLNDSFIPINDDEELIDDSEFY